MKKLWQTGTVLAIGLAWVLMGAADSWSQTSPTGTWEKRADVPYRVQEIYPAFHKGELYLAGGFSPDVAAQQISDRVYIYDPGSDSWRQGASLPEPRHHPYLVSSGEKLFSFGGFVAGNGGRWSASTDVLMLDEDDDRWVKVADLLHPQSETVAGLIEGKVYLASGRKPGGERNADWNDQVDINQVQVFDPTTYAVSTGPAAPSARNSAAGAVIDGKLYVVGGRVVGGGNKVANEVFDPATQSWQTLTPMPNAQGGIAAAALDGKLYVFGGEFFGSGGGGVYEECWVYDVASDAWAPVTPMPLPRHGLGAVTIGAEIYVVAGASEAGGSGTTNRLAVFRP